MAECDYARCEREATRTTGDGGQFCDPHFVEKVRLDHATEGAQTRG
jgi:hypothetical protein